MPYADPFIAKEYHRDYMRNYLHEHPQVLTLEQKDRNKMNAEKREKAYYADVRFDAFLRRTYGITLEEYNALLVKQNGHCALCPAIPNGRRLHVDHDHKTHAIRGLLCRKCNSGLGSLGDNEAGLLRALAYVRGNG